jgi:hypothetical protein
VRGEVLNVCWWGDLMEIYHPEDLDVNGRIILKFILKWDMEVWAGFFWLRIGAAGRELVIAVMRLCVT